MKPALNSLWLSLALILAACGKGDDKKPAASTTQAAAAQTPPAAEPAPGPRGPGDTAPPPGANTLLARYDLPADLKELQRKVDVYGRAVHAFDARPNRRTAAHAITENEQAVRYAREKVAAYRAFPYEIFGDIRRSQVTLIRNGEEFLASPAAQTARSMEKTITTLERQQQLLRQLRRFRPW